MNTALLKSVVLISFLFIACIAAAQTGGVKGIIKADDGSTLPFTTIYVRETGTGVTSNQEGYYEMLLAPGTYKLAYQFLGYETIVVDFEVGTAMIERDIVMKAQATLLPAVTINSNDEDPAYTIMRKAIAKANYHRNELDSYSARVYIKGAGQLIDYPWLAKRAMAKEGIEKGRVYISESVSEIKYTRPNKHEEKVISIRSDGKDNNTSPNQYINQSFYEPVIQDIVSPLSPRAFSYYRFEYLGTFKDRGYEISRIKVIPRSKGDNVVDGEINIIENWWSIYSFDFHTTKLGIDINLKALSAPIEDKVWLPVSHQFKIRGTFFGFEFEYKYLASVSDYKIKVNPKIYVETAQMEVVDEKIEKEKAKEIKQSNAAAPKKKKKLSDEEQAKQLQERLTSGKEITRKELNSMMKEYERIEQKTKKEPEVLSEVTFKVDSGAYKKDSAYWTKIRPIPLSKEEVIGYQKSDSVAEIDRRKESGDTLKSSKHRGFQVYDILIGDSYKVSKHSTFRIHMPMPGFNTVEGFNLIYKLSFGTIVQDTNKTRFLITPTFRYAHERRKVTGNLAFSLRNKKYRLELSGGRYVKQFNPDEPILPIVNTFMTLLLEQNLMKIYERDYVDLLYRRKFSDYFTVTANLSWAKRRELFNNTSYKLIDRKGIEDYTPNRPDNPLVTPEFFPTHNALIGAVGIAARPWLKYRIRNGQKHELQHSSPIFTLDYKKGIRDVLESDVDFDQLEIGVKHAIKIGVRGNLDFALRAGKFLNNNKVFFMDYKHFLGNRTPFSTTDPVGSFRLLDYYKYSTPDEYFSANVHYHFRRFLVTSIPMVRMLGIRENVFVNYLATPLSGNYTEFGYGIDGILRIFRLEVATAFRNGKYQDYGFRIGIATNIAINFSDN